MTKLAIAAALTTALVEPASAITFPSLTTIYVGTGVRDSGDANNAGQATAFQCSNVSGESAQVRILVLQHNGAVAGQSTVTLSHGANLGISTHLAFYWFEDATLSTGTEILRGTVNIESTQSGVFCQAYLVDASAIVPNGVALHLVRVNPHPGTVE